MMISAEFEPHIAGIIIIIIIIIIMLYFRPIWPIGKHVYTIVH